MRFRVPAAVLVGFVMLVLPTASGSIASPARWTPGDPIVLHGAVLTPQTFLNDGYVLIDDGRIISVSDKHPDVDGATEVDTDGVIYPGLVDLHNHVPWNVLPRWNAPHLYSNRYEWRVDPDFQQKMGIPFNNLIAAGDLCDMNAYGEVRALLGGVTSIIATHRAPCIHGLVRNLDFNSEFYGTTQLNRERIVSAIEVPPPSDPMGRAQFVTQASIAIANPAFEALLLHLSEGVDASSLEEFTFVQSNNLLNPKSACIHCVALGFDQFIAMAASGVSLVWSPVSNVSLYGTTTDIASARAAGVRIALAPDWAVSGSSNMLDELHFADQWNRDHLGGLLSDQELVEMVTSTPAAIARIDDEVGTIKPGLRADLLVISGADNRPYRGLIEAKPTDVQLVLIGGVPVYGDGAHMRPFWANSDLQPISIGGAARSLAGPAAQFNFADVVSRLTSALQAQGVALAPLTETGN